MHIGCEIEVPSQIQTLNLEPAAEDGRRCWEAGICSGPALEGLPTNHRRSVTGTPSTHEHP